MSLSKVGVSVCFCLSGQSPIISVLFLSFDAHLLADEDTASYLLHYAILEHETRYFDTDLALIVGHLVKILSDFTGK